MEHQTLGQRFVCSIGPATQLEFILDWRILGFKESSSQYIKWISKFEFLLTHQTFLGHWGNRNNHVLLRISFILNWKLPLHHLYWEVISCKAMIALISWNVTTEALSLTTFLDNYNSLFSNNYVSANFVGFVQVHFGSIKKFEEALLFT